MFCDERLGYPRWFTSPPKDAYVRVPDAIRDGVAFLATPSLDKPDETVVGGSAFFVSVPSVARPHSRRYEYLVTAQHNLDIVNDKPLYVRLNMFATDTEPEHAQDILLVDNDRGNKRGKGRATEQQQARWYRHPSDEDPQALRVDVAVCPWAACHDRFRYGAFGVGRFVNDEVLSRRDVYGTELGAGDEVFIVGLFTKVTGRRVNMPIVRIGNVAMMPEEPVPTKYLGEIEAYLIEARSIGGLSGSPCFIRYSSEIDSANFYLLGLVHGHWQIPLGTVRDVATDATDEALSEAQQEAVNMGIGIVVPAQKIYDVLYCSELIEERARQDRELERENLPTPD
jgi:hypothetical protein